MAKLRPGEKRVQLSFQREDDLRLYAFMQKRAYECRWDLPTFILASLQDAFKGQIDEEEVNAAAEEALRKVRERQTAPPEKPVTDQLIDAVVAGEEISVGLQVNHNAPPLPPAPKPTVMSPDEAYEQAVKQVQQLNAEPMKKKTPVRGKAAASPQPPVQ